MTESLPGEALLHYVWKHKLYVADSFRTTDKMPLEIIDTGIYNSDAGPDFFNAKIRIGNEIWAGNIEIHSFASDWIKHNHHIDKAYNSVILHVVEYSDTEIQSENGHIIPQLILKVPENIRDNYEYLLSRNILVPCLSMIGNIPNHTQARH